MTEIMIRFNNIYAKFYDRKTGNKIYRANFGNKFSDIGFKRANEAIKYKSKVMLRYINLTRAHKDYIEEQNKTISKTDRWIDRLINFIKSFIFKLINKEKTK